MGFTDTLKNLFLVQDAPVLVETKGTAPVAIAPAVSYPNYRVLNTGSLSLGTNTQATNTVFLSILGRIQSAARVVDWKAVWVKADGTEADAPTSPMARLLTRPNAEQTWAAFVNQYLTQLLQHGNVFIYCDWVLAPSINVGQAQELRIMPSNTEVIGGQGWRQPVLSYRVPLLSGGYDTFAPDQVVHVKRWQLTDTSPYGLSPVQAAALQLQNLSLATRQRLKQMADGGPNVLLFSKASPELESMTTEQSDALIRKVTGPNKMTYVEGEYGTLQAGLSPVDLDIINSVKLDAGMVADVLNFPAQLLSTSEGNTFANVGEATKALYSDCVLPLLWELMDSLNHKLNDAKYRIQLDTSGVEPLKPNLVPLLTALASADYLSVHQKIDMLGLEKPIGEDVYILTKSAKVVKDLKEAPTPEALEVPGAPTATNLAAAKTGGNAPANPA